MKVKTIKSIAITAIMAFASLVALPMSASAITDPNGDGIINISDVVIIRSYVNGQTHVSDLSSLDFNGNNVVDMVDVIRCQRYCTGMD